MRHNRFGIGCGKLDIRFELHDFLPRLGERGLQLFDLVLVWRTLDLDRTAPAFTSTFGGTEMVVTSPETLGVTSITRETITKLPEGVR